MPLHKAGSNNLLNEAKDKYTYFQLFIVFNVCMKKLTSCLHNMDKIMTGFCDNTFHYT